MTNPDRAELVKLAATIEAYGFECEGGPLKNCKPWMELKRRLASSDGGVKVKPLVWRDHRPDSFPEPAWSAQTSFGFYNIEEVSASDSPAYVVRLHAHHFVADKDSLDDAKAAAQADYEARIRSALVEVPASPTPGDVRELIRAEIENNTFAKSETGSIEIDAEGLILTLSAALAANQSDGGEPDAERTQRRLVVSDDGLGPMQAIPREPPSGPSDPSSTRSEVTVELIRALIRKHVTTDLYGCLAGTEEAARALLNQFEIRRK